MFIKPAELANNFELNLNNSNINDFNHLTDIDPDRNNVNLQPKAADTPKAVEQLQAVAVASWSRCVSTPRAEQSGASGCCCAGK